jgi:hypothetical protein
VQEAEGKHDDKGKDEKEETAEEGRMGVQSDAI